MGTESEGDFNLNVTWFLLVSTHSEIIREAVPKRSVINPEWLVAAEADFVVVVDLRFFISAPEISSVAFCLLEMSSQEYLKEKEKRKKKILPVQVSVPFLCHTPM